MLHHRQTEPNGGYARASHQSGDHAVQLRPDSSAAGCATPRCEASSLVSRARGLAWHAIQPSLHSCRRRTSSRQKRASLALGIVHSHAVLRGHDGARVRLLEHCAAVRATEAGDKRGSGRWPDLCVRVKSGEHRREGRRMGVLEVERLQDEPAWC